MRPARPYRTSSAATANVGGDVGSVARQAMEGAIEGAASIGIKGVDAIGAAASGAIRGVGNVAGLPPTQPPTLRAGSFKGHRTWAATSGP